MLSIGINNLFPPWSGQTVEEKANIMVRRHDNNYYVDYTLDRIQELPEIERPKQVVTLELRVCKFFSSHLMK